MSMSGPVRVVVAELSADDPAGSDGSDGRAEVIARALRDAGMEVVHAGVRPTPEQIVDTAVQEDADGIGLSLPSGAHTALCGAVMLLLGERDAEDITVFCTGTVPAEDVPLLRELGVGGVLAPEATTSDIVAWVEGHLRDRHLPDPATA